MNASGALTEVGTAHLPITSLKHYRSNNRLSTRVFTTFINSL